MPTPLSANEKVTRQVPLVDQELVTIPEDLDPSKLEFDIHIRRGSFLVKRKGASILISTTQKTKTTRTTLKYRG
jgi:glyoxylate utilization-related uncharacterized protein